jgi:hypothetical protein
MFEMEERVQLHGKGWRSKTHRMPFIPSWWALSEACVKDIRE